MTVMDLSENRIQYILPGTFYGKAHNLTQASLKTSQFSGGVSLPDSVVQSPVVIYNTMSCSLQH